MQLPRRVPFEPRAIQCTQCGAPLTIRDVHHTRSVSCDSCGSILDARDPGLAILEASANQARFQPQIPLGQRGQLMGDKWECIGAMLRATEVEGIDYFWREYLLFNPWKGYRWLVEQNGHWLWVEPAMSYPLSYRKQGREVAEHQDTEFRLFQTCRARVQSVVGEFYWQVSAGEQVTMQDYVAPPFTLSKERSRDEVVWSLGAYVPAFDVKNAFGLGEMSEPRGVAPAQPNPYDQTTGRFWARTLLFLLVGLFLHTAHLSRLDTKKITSFQFRYEAADPAKAKVSEPFEITGGSAVIQVDSQAAVNNSWVYLQMALINDETQIAYDFAREIEFYSGVDSDGSWSEGSSADSVVIGTIPAGRYYLLVEPQTEMPAVDYTVTISRDPPSHWPYAALLFLFLAPLFLHHSLKHSFEVTRWSESDYPLYEASDE